MPHVRIGARAMIIDHDRLLVAVLQGDDGEEFWLLPGGGQEHQETLPEAVRRECLEEIGCDVIVGDVVWIRDFVEKNHPNPFNDQFHQVDIVFAASLADGAVPVLNEPDERQIGIAWVPLSELSGSPLYPQLLRDWITADPATRPIYLGDVN